ncbi:MAG: winged helix-turn-helix transcriptional regulator [Candidatus Aenigmatarchaeota archaeon]
MHLVFVKLLAIVSFFLALIFFIPISLAQVQFYGIDVNVDKSGRSFVTLTVTFSEIKDRLEFDVIGRVEGLRASSEFGNITCKAYGKGISEVKCDINISVGRTVKIYYETSDFVKSLEEKYYFDGDFSLKEEIERVFASVKLPEGMALIEENLIASKVSFPENASTSTLGRRIIVIWKLEGIKANQPLKLQFLYEQIAEAESLNLIPIIILGLAIGLITIFAYVRFFKKPEKLVLSVLDEFERKVMDAIIAAGGMITQKKVVEQTNLSKAKVSRVVKSLVERGLIEVESLGRTNKLKLVKKKFKL